MRPTLALSALTVLALSASASAGPARVSGGGFVRDGHGRSATKTTLSLQGDPASNRGTATYTVSKPGASTTSTRITLTCVVVDGSTAYAAGRDPANGTWFLKVVDNGEPGRNDQFGVSRTGDTLLGLLPMPGLLATNCNANDVATRALSGGNFQVVPA